MPLSLLAGTPLPRSCAGWSQLQHDDQATRCPLMRELTTSYLKISNLSQKINVDNILSKMTKPGAPRRALTCWDSISDLPPIPSGHDQLSINYQVPFFFTWIEMKSTMNVCAFYRIIHNHLAGWAQVAPAKELPKERFKVDRPRDEVVEPAAAGEDQLDPYRSWCGLEGLTQQGAVSLKPQIAIHENFIPILIITKPRLLCVTTC